MKTRSFAFMLSILFVAFTINTVIMAQSYDSKKTDSKNKTTVNKTETNKTEVKQMASTTNHNTTKK